MATGPKQAENIVEQTVMLQQHEYLLEHAKDSVMTRTMEGIINFWNRSAEGLYGWRKEEAVGRVSHDLLQTQFPKPLEEIESELVRNGQWEGKLVHTTRDGGRVLVESRWILDTPGQAGAVVEINARSTDRQIDPEMRVDDERLPKAGNIVRTFSLCLVAGLAAVWLVYVLLGHRIIDWLYTTESLGIIDQLLEGRRFTPLHDYYRAADALLMYGTLRLLAVYGLVVLLIRKPSGAFLLGFSSFLLTFTLFSLLEIFPSLIRPFHLAVVSPYHGYKTSYLYDEELAYREKPFNRLQMNNFRGSHYSPLYGVDVPPRYVEWEMDKHGFRNSVSSDSAEIIAVGDSSFEYGDSTADTFTGRLEKKLTGLKVINLSKSGYGPHQYLAVLKRFGVTYKPKYALFGFCEGNDITNIRNYLRWKSGAMENDESFLRFSQSSFLRRYWAAMEMAAVSIRRSSSFTIESILDKVARIGGYGYEIHPRLARLKLGEGTDERVLFVDRLEATGSTEKMLRQEEWRELEKILLEIKEFSAQHGIVPILVYIPGATHIYARFSTDTSGQSWLSVRDSQIAARENTANAVRRLAQNLDISLIDLSPPSERAAKEGKLLYERLDSHWNSDGRELAASSVADYLRGRYFSPSDSASQSTR
jgi:PAS domain S-box-containing protein